VTVSGTDGFRSGSPSRNPSLFPCLREKKFRRPKPACGEGSPGTRGRSAKSLRRKSLRRRMRSGSGGARWCPRRASLSEHDEACYVLLINLQPLPSSSRRTFFSSEFRSASKENKTRRADAYFDLYDDNKGPESELPPQDHIRYALAVTPSRRWPPAADGKPSFAYFSAAIVTSRLCRPNNPTTFRPRLRTEATAPERSEGHVCP